MARIRSSPRSANRHSGQSVGRKSSDELWERGGQYIFNKPFKMHLGPWKGVGSELPTEAFPQFMIDTFPGIVRNGKIVPTLRGSSNTTEDSYSQFDLTVQAVRYKVRFYESSGNIEAGVDDGTGESTTSSATYAGNQGRFFAVSWGAYIYFIQQGSNLQLRLDPTGPTIALSVTHSDNVDFMFILDRNLCVVLQDTGKAPEVKWSVDSAPTDFTGSGTGNNPLNQSLGQVQGFGYFNNQVTLVTEFSAVRMSPTGTLPAFKFDDVPGITGTAQMNAVDSSPTSMLYIGRDGYPRITQGGVARPAGSFPPRWQYISGDAYVFYIAFLDLFFVWSDWTGAGEPSFSGVCWLFDANVNEWVGTIPKADWGSDVIWANSARTGTLVEQLLYLTGDTTKRYEFAPNVATQGADGTMYTPWMRPSRDIEILYIDIERTHETHPIITDVEVESVRGKTTTTTTSTQKHDESYYERFYAHIITNTFRLKITFEDSQQIVRAGISGIDIVGNSMDRADEGLLSG